LLPGTPGNLVLVTSRNGLAGLVAIEGARPVALGAMSAEESRLLLTRRLGPDRMVAEPAAVGRIVDACQGLPLALAAAAAFVATPTRPIEPWSSPPCLARPASARRTPKSDTLFERQPAMDMLPSTAARHQ